MAFVELQRTQSLTRPMTHAAISTSHNSISSPYSQSYSPRVLQHQKQTQYSMLQIKPISKKHISTIAILLLHHHLSFIYPTSSSEGPHKLREEVTKHTHIRHNHSSLTTKLPLVKKLMLKKLFF